MIYSGDIVQDEWRLSGIIQGIQGPCRPCLGIPGLDFSDQKQAVPSADCLRGKQVGDGHDGHDVT